MLSFVLFCFCICHNKPQEDIITPLRERLISLQRKKQLLQTRELVATKRGKHMLKQRDNIVNLEVDF